MKVPEGTFITPHPGKVAGTFAPLQGTFATYAWECLWESR
jgi:hypothetical protein